MYGVHDNQPVYVVWGPIRERSGAETFRPNQVSCLEQIFFPAQCCSMLRTRPWTCLQRFAISNRVQSWSTLRCQSTAPSRASTISPTLLSRAQALAAEHAELSKQLNSEYDNQIAKKAGSLAAVTTALNSWESANKVCLYIALRKHGH